MFTKIINGAFRGIIAAVTVLSSVPVHAQSMKLSRPDVIESQDSKVNYVINPSGFKNALNITTSNATIAQDTSGATDLLDGIASLVCDASAQNGYCEWDSKTIQEGDKTGNCEGKAVFKGDASLYKLQVTDGSNVLNSSSVLPNASDWTEVSINYPCGSTREVRLTQTEAGTGAAVNIGRVYWGRATNLGAMNPIGDWVSYTPTSSTWVSGATFTGKYRRVGDTMEVNARVAVTGTPTSADLAVSIPSGHTIDTTKLTSVATNFATSLGSASMLAAGARYYVGTVTYFSTTEVGVVNSESGNTGVTNQASPAAFAASDVINVNFTVPIVGWGSQPVVNDNLTPWYVDATMDGANPSLGTSNQTAYLELTDSGLTLKPQSGSQPVGVMCSGVNAAVSPSTSNTVCPSSNESVGINFSIPKSGAYEICFYGSHFIGTDSVGDEIAAAFQLIETPTNAQTLTLEGGTRVQSQYVNPAAAAGQVTHPITNCSIFNWASSGTKGVRLMYEQSVNSSPTNNFILADTSASIGQRNMRWTVKPVTASSPMPLLTGSVTSNSSGLERIERARVTNTGVACNVTTQSGSWISTGTRNGNGDCTWPITSGLWSATPTCTCTVLAGIPSTQLSCAIGTTSADSATLLRTVTYNSSGAANQDLNHNIICVGPR